MAEARLEVEIAAKLEGFGKDLNSVITSVENVDKKVSVASNNVSKSLAKTAASAKSSGVQFVGLSRVMQDFAFGPIAIANNLEGLANDFRQLSAVSKETGQSLGKTLIASLTGGGGLNIALGAATLAMTMASFGMQAWSKLFPSAKKEVEDYAKTLDALSQAKLKGEQDAQKELTSLNLLYKATQDTTLSYEQRKRAVDELQTQYPAYFGNIKDETLLAGKAEQSYINLSKAIIAAGRARAAENLITEKQQKVLELERKINENGKARLDARIAADKAKKLYDSNNSNSDLQAGSAGEAIQLAKANVAYNNVIEEGNAYTKERRDLLREIADLSKSAIVDVVNGPVEGGKSGTSSGGGTDNKKDLDYSREVNTMANLAKKHKEASDQLIDNAKNASVQVPESFRIMQETSNDYIRGLNADFVNSMYEFSDGLKSIQENALGSIGGFFESLGAAMAQGNFENFGEGILKAFAGFLGQLGQLFIKQGAAEIAFGAAQNLILPGSGANRIAGGIGMIAAGSAISLGSGLLGSASIGGKGGRGGSAMKITSDYSTSSMSLPSGNRLASISSGRQEPLVIGGNIRFDAGQMYLELEREGARRNRVR